MKILGADTSSVSTGWCIVENGKIEKTGVIRPLDKLAPLYKNKTEAKANVDEQDILRVIASEMSKLLTRHEVDRLVVEDCYLGKNVRTLQLLARLSGAILWDWLQRAPDQRKALIISAASARKMVGCKGNAKKPEVVSFVRYRYGSEAEDDNVADGIVLAMAGWETFKGKSRRGGSHGNRI